ncbi:tripartite tricarboxylate transporter substrate binding protein [Comamonas testosteroni]|uniref:Bug family tripartite tricarboxylate transporter substrate binding protein n=1 Tax=Comamonas testosteroni TaxID=285 RepID=UPI00265D7B72|nr:tripartite tricarboxylate transporter substrate binding protein [Comamonas testosteroni]WKL15241.1 tripartite tricarboxylate transporter substrate binding protein [Comamonas testosteroni]WQD41362.1 tripartite tricarboxylate transporter substrate binding protein [Comamonas testosteroni]
MKATTPASRSSVDTADSRTATASALRRKSGLAVMAVAVAASLTLPAQAEQSADWPSKPIRLIVTGPAGGTADTLARLLAEGMQQELKQPVIVESKAGASGAIGIQDLKSHGKSGYTFLVIQDGALSEAPLAQKVSFDPFKDLTPLAQLTRTGLVMVANKDLPFQTLPEFISYARQQRDGVDFASYATGLKGHTSGMLLGQLAKINMRHVGYKGSPPALVDLMGGHVPVMFDGVTTSLPLIRSGKIKALAAVYPSRLQALPDVPTFTELGYPQLSKPGWFALWSHPQTPAVIQQKLRDVALTHFRKESVLKQLAALGMEPGQPLTTAEMTAELKEANRKQAALLKSIGYKPEN